MYPNMNDLTFNLL